MGTRTPRASSASRWHEYYQQAFTPWDSEHVSSQLRYFLANCVTPDSIPPCPGPHEFQDFTDALSSAVNYHHCPQCVGLKPLPGRTALEIGCGTGASCVALAAAGFQVVGIDLVPAAVQAAQQRALLSGVADCCRFICTDCFQLPECFRFEGLASAALPGQEEQQTQQQHGAADDRGAAAGAAGGPEGQAAGFDFIYDCQTYHVLRTVDDAAAMKLYHRLLRPCGLLMLLTGNANEPYVGPNILTREELVASFVQAGLFECVWVVETRFDTTQHYRDELGKRPLAWWALLRKKG